ncbi:MAG: hypothetical protein NUV65_04605 [Candidatus Roizmanbacteria bacterium]|nr:hypothetical protein [Candidatus Roizmanbacteria bacterium]
MNIETIEQKIGEREQRIRDLSITVIEPEQSIGPEIQAQWMIDLLSKIYVNHGVTQNPQGVIDAIVSGDMRCWFALDVDNSPVSVAALIAQRDGAVELGRAVALQTNQGVGGLLMLTAALDHIQHSEQPLVAEVRMADEFHGVHSSHSTQVISFGHIGLHPHALVPAFHHGEPNRQEPFAFSSSRKILDPEKAFLADPTAQVWQATLGLMQEFAPSIQVEMCESGSLEHGWTIVQEKPFVVVVPERSTTTNLDTTLQRADNLDAFTLIPISLSSEMAGAVNECLRLGLVPCGIDRSLDENGHPQLLMGRLRQGTMLAPMVQVPNALSQAQSSALRAIDQQFRKQI